MRHTHKIAKHLYLKRAGLQELSFPTKPVLNGELVPEANPLASYRAAAAARVESQTPWHEPDHGLAIRVPALKQAKTTRGHTLHGSTVVYHESRLEHRVSKVLQTYRGLKRLVSQYPKVEYLDDEGVIHKHTCDYFIELDDGSRLAIAVKYERKRKEMLDLLDRICANGITAVGKDGKLTPGIADAMVLVTDALATDEALDNAFFILSSRDHHDETECAILHDIVRKLPGTFRFGTLLLNCSFRAKRRTAIWRLLDLNLIHPVSPGRIDELSWLRAAA